MEKNDIKYFLKYKNKQIYVNIAKVSASGMTRKMRFYVLGKNKRLECINYEIATIAGYKLDRNGDLIVGGCGMDMVFSVLSNFNYAICTIIDGKMTKNYSTYFFNANNYQLI